VQNGNELRHRRHLHARSDERADHRAGNQHGGEKNVTARIQSCGGGDERDEHSRNAVKIPAPGCFLPRESSETHNKHALATM
jgi:hypothetical protein